ncbi:MAG: helix-turn-helix transcriptional regulator [Eubacteriales bacterium]|nr:helix-turn-helix transcriptional regulator [Eubacteriales bacterium]
MQRGILGNAIRKARLEKGFSQEELAEIVDITPTHMKHLESEHRKPSIEVLEKLMIALDLSFDMIVFPEMEKIKAGDWPVLLADCSKSELNIIRDVIISMKKNRSR